MAEQLGVLQVVDLQAQTGVAVLVRLGAVVIRIQRVRELNGAPVIYELLSVPTALFPGLEHRAADDVPNTLYEFYELEYGVMIVHASERLRAIRASGSMAKRLTIEPGTPLLTVERLALNTVIVKLLVASGHLLS